MRYLLPVLALLFLLTIALGVHIAILTLAILFLAVLSILSRLWTRTSMAALRVERTVAERAFVGESFPVTLTVTNRSALPVAWVEMDEPLPLALTDEPLPTQAFGLGPHEHRRFDYPVHCRRRGYYQLGPTRIRTGDLLGFAERIANLSEPSRLIVYPRVLPMERLTLPAHAPLALLHSPSALFEDPARISGVRDYQPGDSVRRIHWTATARMGRMLVKQYQRGISRDTLVCLDLDLKGYDVRWRNRTVETAIEVTASVAYHVIMREGLAAGLATEALDSESGATGPIRFLPAPGERQLMAMLELLARIQPASVEPLAHRLRRETASLAYGSTVVVVTGQLSEDLELALVALKRSAYQVTVILVEPSQSAATRTMLGRIPIYRVNEEFAGGLLA